MYALKLPRIFFFCPSLTSSIRYALKYTTKYITSKTFQTSSERLNKKRKGKKRKMTPINLSPDTIDDLIYSARIGDLAALQEDISAASTNSSSSQAVVIASAVDSAPEAEGGSGSCLLHFPAANGNIGMFFALLIWMMVG